MVLVELNGKVIEVPKRKYHFGAKVYTNRPVSVERASFGPVDKACCFDEPNGLINVEEAAVLGVFSKARGNQHC